MSSLFPTTRSFGGYVLYKMPGVVCPGFGPWMIRPSNLAPAGPYYIFNTSLAELQEIIKNEQNKLKETRDKINQVVSNGGEPSQQLLADEQTEVENMTKYRKQINDLQSSFNIEPYRWILGNYNLLSTPCTTDSVPPVPFPAFSIRLFGVSQGAQVVGR